MSDGLNGRGESAEILEIEIEELGGLSKEGFGLGGVAAKNRQFNFPRLSPLGGDWVK